MSNLQSPHKYLASFIEGTVLSVDPKRYVCSVKTVNNKIFRDVRWLIPTGGFSESGMHITPNVQDRVLVSTALGYPIILGCIPRIGTYNGEVANMTGSPDTPDLGTDSVVNGAASANPSKPADLVTGDFVYTAKGGSLIGILASGIAILRASVLSQIIMSKFEGLVRIVTRNYQRFSDSSSNVATNMKGRLYEWFGADWSILNNQTGQERYQEVYGDVAAGEVLRGAPSPATVIPVQDTRVRKEWLKDALGNSVMVETLYQDGTLTFIVENTSSNNTTTDTNGSHTTTVASGTNTSHIAITPASLVISSTNGTIPSTITLTPSSAVVDFNGVSKGTFDATQASITSGTHFCTVTSAGVALG